jgi:hypothetical protein
MTILYRILGFFINTMAVLLFISLISSFGILLSSAATLLPAFMLIATILYSFFSYKFHRQVLQQQQTVSKKLRDWVRVNGIVAIVFSVQIFLGVTVLLKKPEVYSETMSKFGMQVSLNAVQGFFIFMLVYAIALLVHILWTFALMKKNESSFE